MATIDLADYSLLKISGADAKKFLQGQLTCDLEKVDVHTATLGAYCNAKGRVVSLFRLFRRDSDYYLLMPENVINAALAALKKYAIFSKVTLHILQSHCYGLLTAQHAGYLPTRDHQVQHHKDTTYIRVPDREPRYLLIDFADSPDPTRIASTAWHLRDISAGIPRLYPETIGEFLPHYLNLPALGAISFTKGCYTGQEIIARMQHRGKLKQHLQLRRLHTDKNILPGSQCRTTENRIIGQIIDGVTDGMQQLCLVLLYDQFANTKELMIDNDMISVASE